MKLFLTLLLVTQVLGDVYFHSPRGSNDRLNEKSAQRTNANRLYDSQNNNRGGYNVGDLTDRQAGQDESKQYRMEYFMSSSTHDTKLTLEWTNQHGCGGDEDNDPHKQNCNIVFQYMCQPDQPSVTGTKEQDLFRNGVNTGTQNYNAPGTLTETEGTYKGRRRGNIDVKKGYMEPHAWYDKCFIRERNKGLFNADQKLKSNNGLGYSSAIYTRQNANGNRRGYECPEERDYYPYWHPSPWKDIAVLAENSTMCSHYQSKSFNVQPYYECVENWTGANKAKHASRWNNEKDCTDNSGSWRKFYNYLEKASQYQSSGACTGAGEGYVWGIPHDSEDRKSPECLVALKQPDCQAAPWTRSNHLGNGREGVPNNYTWNLPYFPSGATQRCVLRIRYNISTDDYDPYHTDSRHNENIGNMVQSPVENNPYVEIGAGSSPLRLAINTAQFGRTFQDRTHIFKLKARPSGMEGFTIQNLNVRGKRGNIVQVYPAVEYDFLPNRLHMDSEQDLLHIQWTGSNSHNNGHPAGDGQAGDAGEGTGGTDRNNMVEISDANENFPVPFERSSLWKNAEVKWIYHGHTNIKPEDLAVNLASSGYYGCLKTAGCPAALQPSAADTKATMNNLLNNAPASYQGVLLKLKPGEYYYICSRNNNFTNRSQKGQIHVTDTQRKK